MAYDDDKFGMAQTLIMHIPKLANDAAEVIARIQFFTNVKIVEVRNITVSTAYSVTNTIQIYNDDTHIGEMAAGTALADVNDAGLTAASTGILVNATSSLEFQQSTAAAIGQCHLMVHYQEMFEGA